MGKWDGKKFSLIPVKTFDGFQIGADETFCGMLLTVRPPGVGRNVSVGKGLGVDTDASGRIKFFRGSTPDHIMIDPLLLSHKVSSLTWHGREWALLQYGDVLILKCDHLHILFITPDGVYRSPNCGGTGLPCNDSGQVEVLR